MKSIQVPDEVWKQLKQLALDKDTTIAGVIASLLEQNND
jgi:predicted DNA-binding ribbon-helix-helix protein